MLERDGYRARVMNTGVSGFGTAEELVLLEHGLKKYHPDIVVPGVDVQNILYSIPGTAWLREHSYFYSVLFNQIPDLFQKQAIQRSNSGACCRGRHCHEKRK